MYVNLDDEILDLTKVTKGFLNNALTRYEAMDKGDNRSLEHYESDTKVKEAIKAELKDRARLRFKIIRD